MQIIEVCYKPRNFEVEARNPTQPTPIANSQQVDSNKEMTCQPRGQRCPKPGHQVTNQQNSRSDSFSTGFCVMTWLQKLEALEETEKKSEKFSVFSTSYILIYGCKWGLKLPYLMATHRGDKFH